MFGWLFGQHSFSNFKIVIAASREAKMASNFCRWSNWDLLTVKFSWKKKFPNSAKTSQQEQKLQSGESACFSWVPVSHKRRHWHLHSFLELQCNGHLLKLCYRAEKVSWVWFWISPSTTPLAVLTYVETPSWILGRRNTMFPCFGS